ncbi:GL24069 [Drosophila persimilis]|uniref:GL24069 n=1 Tax=Drosophila persimilis TaxID=7234 RepID=B4G3B1_DROPE|nr:GL24069 [Drosophila persimilis]
MNGISKNLAGGCLIKTALIVGLLVSLASTLPVTEEQSSTAATNVSAPSIQTTEKLAEGAELVDGPLDAAGQLRFPPDGNGGFFQKFGQRLKNKKTTTTTTTTTTTSSTTQPPSSI